MGTEVWLGRDGWNEVGANLEGVPMCELIMLRADCLVISDRAFSIIFFKDSCNSIND